MSLFIFIHHYAPLLCGENPYDFEKTPTKIASYRVKLMK